LQRRQTETRRVAHAAAAKGAAEVRRHVKESIERAVGSEDAHALHFLQPAAHQIPTRLELLAHLFDAVLVALQCGDRAGLADAARAAGLLALYVAHRLDDVRRAARPAHAPAGHRVRLARPADRDGSVHQPRTQRRETRRLRSAEDQLLIDLVA